MSITLTTPVSFTINGVTETDTIGAATSCLYDFQSRALTVTYKIGTALVGNSLNQGPAALANGYTLTVQFNLSTGAWSYTYGTQSGGGTITGTPLTTQQTNVIALRNQLEAFVDVTGGLLPGTDVPWTQI
jgi:hypothetical protein